MMDAREREWLRPEKIPEPPRAAGERTAMSALRPLSLGEVLDRTFSLYRSHFVLFASISAVSASVYTVVQAISLLINRSLLRTLPAHPFAVPPRAPLLVLLWAAHGPRPHSLFLRHSFGGSLSILVAGFASYLVVALTQAATALAVSQVYLQEPVSAQGALALTGRRWLRWIGIMLWQLWVLVYPMLIALVPGLLLIGYAIQEGNRVLVGLGTVLLALAVLAGFPVGFVLYLRNALAVPAAVLEQLPVRPAVRRSKALTAGTKGRIFVVLLLAGCLLWVVGALQAPTTFLILLAPNQEHYLAQVISLAIAFVGRAVVTPVAMIGLTLVYFDQRVRKEALDLQLLLEGSRRAAGPVVHGVMPPHGDAPLG